MYEDETILVMSLPQPTASLVGWSHQEYLTFPAEQVVDDKTHFLIHTNPIISKKLIKNEIRTLLKQHNIRTSKDFPTFQAIALIQLGPMQLTSEVAENMSDLQRAMADWRPGRFAYPITNARCLPEPVHMRRTQAPGLLWELPHNKYEEEIWRWLYG